METETTTPSTGVETAPPAAPSTEVAPKVTETTQVAEDPKSPASEGVTNSDDKEPKHQYVPFERFQEVNQKAKEAADKAAAMEERFNQLSQALNPQTANEEKIDPEADQLLQKSGYIKADDVQKLLADERAKVQVKSDMEELKAQYGDSFDPQKVIEFADQHMGGHQFLQSKDAFEAAYLKMSLPQLLEDAKKEALDQAHNPSSYSEKPTPGGAKQPAKSQPASGSSIRDRIKSAMGDVGFSVER